LEHTEGLADTVATRAIELKRATDDMSELSGSMAETATHQRDAVSAAVADVKGVEQQVVETRSAIKSARNVSYRTVEQTDAGNTAASEARIAVDEMATAAREIRGVPPGTCHKGSARSCQIPKKKSHLAPSLSGARQVH